MEGYTAYPPSRTSAPGPRLSDPFSSTHGHDKRDKQSSVRAHPLPKHWAGSTCREVQVRGKRAEWKGRTKGDTPPKQKRETSKSPHFVSGTAHKEAYDARLAKEAKGGSATRARMMCERVHVLSVYGAY